VFEAVQRLQRRGGFHGLNLGQARAALIDELLAGHYDTPLGPIHFQRNGEVVQGSFYVAEVRMDPGGRTGRFALVRDDSVPAATAPAATAASATAAPNAPAASTPAAASAAPTVAPSQAR